MAVRTPATVSAARSLHVIAAMTASGTEPLASWRADLLSATNDSATLAIRDGRVREVNAAARRLFGDGCVGADIDELFGTGDGDRLRELAKEQRSLTLELVVRRDGKGRGTRQSFLLLAGPCELLLVARSDRTEREPLEAFLEVGDSVDDVVRRLQPPVESSEDPASALSEALARIAESDVTAVLQTIALQARALTNADYAAIGIGTNPERSFEPWVSVGVPREIAEHIGRAPRPVGLLGIVARADEVVRCKDVRCDPRFRGLPKHHPAMASFLGVPIRQRGRAVGNLYLANGPGSRAFSDTDERVVSALAATAGVAIETALLYVGEKERRAWLHSVIDQLPHGVLLYDEHGRLQAMNQACSGLCRERSCLDRYGNPILVDLHASDGRVLGAEELPMIRAFETGEVILGQELVLQRPDGRSVPVSLSALPVRAPSGKIAGVTMIIEDISERRRLERMREEWSAIIAHDLRQPVGVITLAADLLLRVHAGEWPERERKIIDRIRCASSHLSRMISDLMDASLIESRRLSVNRAPADAGALVHSVAESLDAVAAGYDVRVTIEGQREACIDADRIRQVLGNLISNAAKYGRVGTEILIEMHGRDDSVEIVVSNHGPGIPAQQLPLLFSRFERGREERVAGLGLGLYIAKGLVEAHGGRIWVESVPNETTSFHVLLPRRPPLAACDPSRLH